MVIAPHPDDETLGLGGTILKYKNLGHKVYWLLITDRISNFDYKNKTNCKENIAINNRQAEIEKVAKLYDFDDYFQLKLPDMFLDDLPIAKIIGKIQKKIQSIKPDTVYIPFHNDIHTDHQIVFKASMTSLKIFRAPFIRQILMYEIPSSTNLAIGQQFTPNLFENIGDLLEKKLEIYSVYKSEILKSPYSRSFDSLRSFARHRGARAGCYYAEAFRLIFQKND